MGAVGPLEDLRVEVVVHEARAQVNDPRSAQVLEITRLAAAFPDEGADAELVVTMTSGEKADRARSEPRS